MKAKYDDKSMKSRLLVTGAAIILFLVLSMTTVTIYCDNTVDNLSEQLIRFHVVANSDSVEDQLLKQTVRDEVISFVKPLVNNCKSVEETERVLKSSLPVIQQIAEEVVLDNGKNYSVYVTIDKSNFPTKAYGDIVLPAGTYEACRIVIGEGRGENWWCVMYPPLCYLDVASGVVPLEGKEELKQELNEEQYNIIDHSERIDYQVRFKVVDTINSWIHKENYKNKK